MAIKITLKNSVVQDSVPTTTHLPTVGELAVNANINSIGGYMRASDNSIVKIFGPGSLTTPAASTTAAGIAELATSAETTTGTDAARVTTPAGVKAVTDAERTTSNSTYLAKAGGTLTGVLAATAGSNSAASIHFGDTDSGIYGGTNTVSLAAGGTQGLTLNSDGYVNVPTRLGVGVASPAVAFHINSGATNECARFESSDTEVTLEFKDTTGTATLKSRDDFRFGNSTGELARVDASGRLLVGLTSARTLNPSHIPPFQIEGNTATTSSISTINNINQTGGPSVWLGKSRGAALGGVVTVQSGDELGSIFFNGADGTDIASIGASIVAKSNGTVAGNRMPGELLFATTADSAGSVSPTTRLTITSAGLVNVPDNGKFTAGASDDLQIYHSGTQSYISDQGTGNLNLQGSSKVVIGNAAHDENMAQFFVDGAVELYYDNVKRIETLSTGASINGALDLYGSEGQPAILNLQADEGDDNADKWRIIVETTGNLNIQNYASGSWETAITGKGGGSVELRYDNDPKLATTSYGVSTNITNALRWTEDSNVASRSWQLVGEDGDYGKFELLCNNSDGGTVDQTAIKAISGGAVELYNNGIKTLETGPNASNVRVAGFLEAFWDTDDAEFKYDGTNYAFHKAQSDLANWVMVLENSNDAQPYGFLIKFSDAAPDNNTEVGIELSDPSASRFKVYSDGDVWTSDAGTLTSDETLKENITDATSKLEDIKKLKVRNFNWKASFHPEKSKKKQIGFIAQEVEEVFPSLVNEYDVSPNAGDINHTPIMKKSIKAAWNPIIIKAMQELITKVETLETKVAALEGT